MLHLKGDNIDKYVILTIVRITSSEVVISSTMKNLTTQYYQRICMLIKEVLHLEDVVPLVLILS